MQLQDFTYDLPAELIAKYPASNREESRLLQAVSNNKPLPDLNHKVFKEITELFHPGDLLILNNTKVLSARFYGQKSTGAKLEFLLERILSDNEALVHMKSNRTPKMGSMVKIGNNHVTYKMTINKKIDNLYSVTLNNDTATDVTWYELLEQIGSLPLPHYINRDLVGPDKDRYQTVYARELGAVAAPTAGLHFTQELLSILSAKGVIIKYVTLHVGSGTFAPVRVDNIIEHKMHSERYCIEADVINNIMAAKKNNSRIIAVGTTSLRCLEAAYEHMIHHDPSHSKELTGDTNIFIYPGYEFKLVDCLITNFHLPGSTLMMLVSAFAGCEEIKYIYQQAILNKYKFYSYGDAMWLTRKNSVY